MGTRKTLISGLAIGGGLMYFLDPGRGRRRRALVRDKAASFWSRSGGAIDTTARNLRDRAVGLAAEVRSMTGGEEHVSDELVAERVRSTMGRVVSHPRAIDVSVRDGHVILSGPILEHEVHRLISATESVRGVQGVENHLEVHRERDIPALQGGVSRPGYRWEIMQTNWSPSLRFVMAGLGGTSAAYGMLRRGPAGYTMAGLGSAALLRSIANREFSRIIGIGAGRQAVEIQKTINVDAPVEEVYGLWSHFENFPKFMRYVREVWDLGNGRWHWVVAGPAGFPVRWNAAITRQEPNNLIAWKSEEGSRVQNAGTVHFRPNQHGGTQVDIQMSYNPPAGAIGHAVATILGRSPRHEIDEDLVRFKSLIENRKTSVGRHTVSRDEVMP